MSWHTFWVLWIQFLIMIPTTSIAVLIITSAWKAGVSD